MTLSSVDTPDFQGFQSWRTANALPSLTTTCPVGVTNLGYLAVANFASIELIVVPFLAGVQVTLSWSANAAGTQVIATDTWLVTHATGLHVIIPCRAAYVQLSINNTGASSESVTTWLAGTNTPAVKPCYPVPRDNLGAESTAVPASTTVVFTPAWIHSGQGWIFIRPADGLGKLNFSLDTTDETTAHLRNIWSNNGFTGAADIAFAFPDDLMAVSITNTDAGGAHSLAWSVTCVPY